MTATTLFLFSLVALVAIATPGPTVLLALANGSRYGVRRSLPGMLGAVLSDFVLVGTNDSAVWEPREVLLGIAKADRTEILSGIHDADRVLGAGFGALRGVIVLLVIATVVALTPAARAPAWRTSHGAAWLAVMLQELKPVLPNEVAQHLPPRAL